MALAIGAPAKRTAIEFGATKVVVEYYQRLGGWDMKHVYKNMDLILTNGQRLPSGGALEARITVGHVKEDISDVHFSVHEVIDGKPVKLLYKTTLNGVLSDLHSRTHPVLLEHIQTVKDGSELSIHKLRQALVLLLADAKRIIEIDSANHVNSADGEEKLATLLKNAPHAERPKAPYKELHEARRDREQTASAIERLTDFIEDLSGDILTVEGTELTVEGA